jgi:hypothetical protein
LEAVLAALAFLAGAGSATGVSIVVTGSGESGSGVAVTGVESITGSGTLASCASTGVDEMAMTAAIAVKAGRGLKSL